MEDKTLIFYFSGAPSPYPIVFQHAGAALWGSYSN